MFLNVAQKQKLFKHIVHEKYAIHPFLKDVLLSLTHYVKMGAF